MKPETAVKHTTLKPEPPPEPATLLESTTNQPIPFTSGTVLMIGGHNEPPYPDDAICALFSGAFRGDAFHRVAVDYPSNDGDIAAANTVAVANLTAAITAAEPPITVVGMSQGSMIVDQTLPHLTVDQLAAVVISDPNRPGGITKAGEPPATRYPVTQVVGQYDGFTHWPRAWWNVMATTNALIGTGATGGYSAHGEARWADLTQAAITTSTNPLGGTTTRYFVRCPVLPIIGRDNAWLRSQIDKGY